MASAAEVRQYRKTQQDIVRLAERELKELVGSLDYEDATKASKTLQLVMPEIVQKYGEVGAAVASDFYEELRTNAKTRKTYRAVMGDAVPLEAVKASTRWAVGPLFQADSDIAQTTSNLSLITDRFVKQYGRNTIYTNTRNDPARVRYARVPSGSDTCAFCLMLASRGAVYASEDTASNDYHGACDCVPTPVFSDDDYPENYNPDELYDLYSEASKHSETGSLTGAGGVLATLREQQGIS